MPIYKAKGKKDGLQRYNVRINYISDSGEAKQLTRIAYGLYTAKNLEMRLIKEIKINKEKPIKKMTVQELFEEYRDVKKYEIKELSLFKIENEFKDYIGPVFNNCRIDRVTAIMLQNWKMYINGKNLSLGTKKGAFLNFRAMFKYAMKMEYIRRNPFEKVDNFVDRSSVKREMDYYTAEEYIIFIKKAKEIAEEREQKKRDYSEWNYYVFFNIAFYTGLRKGEIFALKWSDIDGEYLSVRRTITQHLKGGDRETLPKNRTSIRTMQMPLPLIKILNEHKQRQNMLYNFSDEYRICNNVRNSTVYIRNIEYATKAGLKTIRIHDFRHSHVSLLASENINIQEVARRLGHARVEMTWNTYCHLYPKEEEKAVSVLNRII